MRVTRLHANATFMGCTVAVFAVVGMLVACSAATDGASAVSADATELAVTTPTTTQPSPASSPDSPTPAPSASIAATPSATVTPTDQSAPRRAYILGDSLTYKARAFMEAALLAKGWISNPATDSRIGRGVAEGLSILAQQQDLPETVLIALGTNDWLATPDQAADWVAQARSIIGPQRELIWVNVQMDGERFTNYVNVNEGLRHGVRADNRTQLKAGATGRSFLADWAAFTKDNGIRHNHDGVHYKAGAFKRRMEFYAAALAGEPSIAVYSFPKRSTPSVVRATRGKTSGGCSFACSAKEAPVACHP